MYAPGVPERSTLQMQGYECEEDFAVDALRNTWIPMLQVCLRKPAQRQRAETATCQS